MHCTCPSKMGTAFRALPKLYKKMIVKKLTPVFAEAVTVVTEPIIKPQSHQVLVRNRYVGVNASDVNMTAGRYFVENPTLPFELGFEGLGEVVDCGAGTNMNPGQTVMYMSNNSFSEYVCLPAEELIPIPTANPSFLPLMASGLTSALSLDKSGNIAPGEKVLITAAAGGAGHIAVQWAKHQGCHVIGTCSSKEKCDFLQSIGCDRPVNYKEESLENVLKAEYPFQSKLRILCEKSDVSEVAHRKYDGIDVIWETIGGNMLEVLINHLAVKGRLIVVGSIANYKQKAESGKLTTTGLTYKLLLNSSSVVGFFLPHYKPYFPHYLSLLVTLMHEEKLKTRVDIGNSTSDGKFQGIEDIPRAVEYLHSGLNKGKVMVAL